jgi:hypothetical protein
VAQGSESEQHRNGKSRAGIRVRTLGWGVGAAQGLAGAEAGSWDCWKQSQPSHSALSAKDALHPSTVSIKLVISILTTQLIRLHELNYDRGGQLHQSPAQERRVIDQNRCEKSWPLTGWVGGGREADKQPVCL